MESSYSDMAGGILFLGFMVVCGLLVLGSMVFWCWMLINSLINNGLTGSEKIAWILVILFGNLIGAIIYFFVGRPKAKLALPLVAPTAPPPA